MASKTISLRLEAYERLKRAKRFPGESFSDVLLRAAWPEETLTAAELLHRYEKQGPFFSVIQLEEIERLKKKDRPPGDKWKRA